MSRIRVIGCPGGKVGERERQLLSGCGLVVASRQLEKEIQGLLLPYHPITPLPEAIDRIRQDCQQQVVAVLASGDPLFYGIGSTLLSSFPESDLEFYPALSAIQLACSRFKCSWEDARIISLHGRRVHHPAGRLLQSHKSLVFTDHHHSPSRLAAELLEFLEKVDSVELAADIRLAVAEKLLSEEERVTEGSLQEMRNLFFSSPNVMLLRFPGYRQHTSRLGLQESEIAHSRGLITKNEVRAATLHNLDLPNDGVFWDVGAGSGSISIEAARLQPGLTIYAVERKPEELSNILANIKRHQCFNVIPVAGLAPAVLHDLPTPDRVFIGGSGGNLSDIISLAGERQPAGASLVVNGVIAATIDTAPEAMQRAGYLVSSSRLLVERTEASGELKQFSPITIIKGRK